MRRPIAVTPHESVVALAMCFIYSFSMHALACSPQIEERNFTNGRTVPRPPLDARACGPKTSIFLDGKERCYDLSYDSDGYKITFSNTKIQVKVNGAEYWQSDLPFSPHLVSPNPNHPIIAISPEKGSEKHHTPIAFIFLKKKETAIFYDKYINKGPVHHATWPVEVGNDIWSPGEANFIVFRRYSRGPLHVLNMSTILNYLHDKSSPDQVVGLTPSSKFPKYCGFNKWNSSNSFLFECSDLGSVWAQEYNLVTQEYGPKECVQGDCLRTEYGYLRFSWNNVAINNVGTSGRSINHEVIKSVEAGLYDLNSCIEKHRKEPLSGTINLAWTFNEKGEAKAIIAKGQVYTKDTLDDEEHFSRSICTQLESCFRRVAGNIKPLQTTIATSVSVNISFFSDPRKSYRKGIVGDWAASQ